MGRVATWRCQYAQFNGRNFKKREESLKSVTGSGQKLSVVDNLIQAPTLDTSPGLTAGVALGAVWTMAGQGVSVLALLVSTPFVLRLLGQEGYAIFMIVNALIAYISCAEFGMGTASTRFAADAFGRCDADGESNAIWTSLIIVMIPATVAAVAVTIAAQPIVERVLNIPFGWRDSAILGLRIAGLGFVFRCISSVLNTLAIVRLRMDIYTSVTAGTAVFQAVALPVALYFRAGVVTATLVVAAANLLALVLHLFFACKLQPAVMKPHISYHIAKKLLRFGAGVFISALAASCLLNTEKLFLARLSSLSTVAHYSVAATLAGLLGVAPAAIIQSLLPAFGRLQATSNKNALQKLYTRAIRGNLLWLCPAIAMLVVSAKWFLVYWAGYDYGIGALAPFYILLLGFAFNTFALVPYTLLMALGRSDLVARIHLAELLPYLVCAAILVWQFGAVGAAIGYTLRLGTDAVLFYWNANRIVRCSVDDIIENKRSYGLSLGLILIPSFAAVFWRENVPLLVAGTIFCLVAFAVVTWIKVFTDEERQGILTLIKRQLFVLKLF